MRKRIFSGIVIGMLVLFGVSGYSHALLFDNGDGTVTQTRSDGSMLMWTKNAGLFQGTWDAANTWIAGINSSNFLGLGYTDWRLPTITDTNNNGCNVGWSGTDCGWNVDTSTSEMAYLYYNELDNLAYYDTLGNGPQVGWGLLNIYPFTNMQSYYWAGTSYAPIAYDAWSFYFYSGETNINYKTTDLNAWAVRDVSAVPEPSTILLLGSALAGLIIYRKKISI